MWRFGLFCLTFSTLVWWIWLPIADVALWLLLIHFQYILFDGFGSRLLMWLFGLISSILSTSVWWIWLPIADVALWPALLAFSTLVWWIRLWIADVALWLALLNFHYILLVSPNFQWIGLMDSAPDCCCGSMPSLWLVLSASSAPKFIFTLFVGSRDTIFVMCLQALRVHDLSMASCLRNTDRCPRRPWLNPCT